MPRGWRSAGGRAKSQGFMVAGSLFCQMIGPFLCPKARSARVGCAAARLPSLFGSGDSLLVRTFPSHFHGTFLSSGGSSLLFAQLRE